MCLAKLRLGYGMPLSAKKRVRRRRPAILQSPPPMCRRLAPAAIRAMRGELMAAWTDAQGQPLRFKVAPVELTLEVAVTWTGKGTAGIKWWLLQAGGEVSREKATTQTIKLTLDPVTLDAQGNVVGIFIDDEDTTDTPGEGGSVSLDADDD